ncbi:Alpha/Beta hydrolase protein [Microdochium bolleyi]|uniref:Alpha/Beta hydrolase protein n=1 Tax=Microdochium bolleyi TaxID=196109 RepID=A0A136IP39_9PEZI|nr:Alpha/Beta hydrolase protein [Microdochium bolleyi]
MASWSALLVRLYISWVRRSKAAFSNADAMRAVISALYLQPESVAPPRLGGDISVERIDVSEWPLYRVRAAAAPAAIDKRSQPPRDAMLYIHGGAFIREAAAQHWKFAAQTARETGLDVLVPAYPLVPRPNATARQIVDGLITIITRLASAADHHRHRIVSIAGDSAGGVRSLVLISPVLDCAIDHPDCVRIAAERDPWLGVEGTRVVAGYYAGGLPVTHPIPSPLYGDITELPPVLLLCGTDDMLCSDARRLAARFRGGGEAGAGSEAGGHGGASVPAGSFSSGDGRFIYVEQRDMIHVYPLLPHWEGAQARELIMGFVKEHLA